MKGQIWSFDYTIGFLLFIFTFFIVGALLFNSFLTADTFDEVYISANAASEYVLSTGYPPYWREDDVIIAGLLTNGKLSIRKAKRLASIGSDADSLREALNSKNDIAIVLRDQNNTIIPIAANCSIGYLDSQLVLKNSSKSIAYYYDKNDLLLATALTLNATSYEDFQMQSLFTSLKNYDLVILEESDFNNRNELSQYQKATALENYVRQGGDLLIIGNVNLTNFINTMPTLQTSAYRQVNNSLFNLSNNIDSITNAYAIQDSGYDRYTSIAKFPDGTDFIASFSLGDGDVYYIGSLQGLLNNTIQGLDSYMDDQLTLFSAMTTADCISIAMPSANDLVSIKRLVAYEGNIIRLEVLSWQ